MISDKLKIIVENWFPPILLRWYRLYMSPYGFFGSYDSWEAVLQKTTGYNSDAILNKVKDAMLQVKEGRAIYERDSVLFDKIQYSWPLLAGLLRIAALNKNRLSVLDFGGALGGSYYQNKVFLSEIGELRWSVVDQHAFVRCGKDYFTTKNLKFYLDIETCRRYEKPNVIILSGVLQYLKQPYLFIDSILEEKFEHIIIDRTSFLLTDDDRLTVQKVSPKIYKASYPAWFFRIDKFKKMFRNEYNLLLEFDALGRSNISKSAFKGFIFSRKKSGAL
jgi:putative methyltransferase (TIGR04325 family)